MTIFDMPLNSIPATTDVAALEIKRRQGQVPVDVGFWGGAVPASLGRLVELAGRRGLRVQVLPARLGRTGVPAAVERSAASGHD